jgi:hypothetical protein
VATVQRRRAGPGTPYEEEKGEDPPPPCDVVARQTVRFCEAFRPRGSCWVGTGLVSMMLLARLLRLLDYMSRGSAITSSS